MRAFEEFLLLGVGPVVRRTGARLRIPAIADRDSD